MEIGLDVVDGLVEELGAGIGTEEEPGGSAIPPHVPKAGRHPVPQKPSVLPQ